MHKSIYFKFILGYLLFALLGFCLISQGISPFARHKLTTDNVKELRTQANSILSHYHLDSQPKTPDMTSLSYSFDAIAASSNTRIQLIENATSLLYDSDADAKKNSSTDPNIKPNLPNLNSLSSNSYVIGTLDGYFEEEMLTFYLSFTNANSTPLQLLIHASTDSISKPHKQMMKMIYFTCIVIYILSFTILLIFTLTVYRPLRNITKASQEYARGNFTYDGLIIESNDEIGHLASSLKYMAGELNTMEEDQKKFISNISHDFRSPLTSIKGYIEAMLDGTIPQEFQEKYLNTVLLETERLTKLTQSMLDLNSWYNKGNKLNLTHFDIQETIRNVLASYEKKSQENHITFTPTFEKRACVVIADEEKIEQVLSNLIDNAIKFSHRNTSIQIIVETKGEKAHISIRDHGIGIPQNVLNKIWDRFYKTDLSRGKDKTGSGLGLAITREIIYSHDENISVSSTLGAGSEFTFTLQKDPKSKIKKWK